MPGHRSRNGCMVTGSIFAGLCIVLFSFLLYLTARKLKPSAVGARAPRSQRMCPYCGLITPQAKTSCLECGRSFNTRKANG